MGDASDEADVVRFMRSAAGKRAMEKIRDHLYGSSIRDIAFYPEAEGIRIGLTLLERPPVEVYMSELSLAVFREKHADVLEAEYYKDFPDRRPKEDGP